MSVPFVFQNSTPPVNPTDLDAEKFNADFDSITNGTAIDDGALKSRMFDETSVLVTYFIKQFITTNDLVVNPSTFGLVNGDVVAINDGSQNNGNLYVVNYNSWVLWKSRTLNITVVNLQTDTKFQLIEDDTYNVLWVLDAVIDDNQTSLNTTWSSAKIRSLFGAVPLFDDEYFVGDGITSSFTLANLPLLKSDMVFIGDGWQKRGVDYTIVGDLVTFIDSNSNPIPVPSGVNFWIHYEYLLV